MLATARRSDFCALAILKGQVAEHGMKGGCQVLLQFKSKVQICKHNQAITTAANPFCNFALIINQGPGHHQGDLLKTTMLSNFDL